MVEHTTRQGNSGLQSKSVEKKKGRLSHQFITFLFIVLFINTCVAVAIAGIHIKNEYFFLIQSRVAVAGNNLKTFIEDIINLGLPISSLEGVPRELEKHVTGDLNALYANVVDDKSRIIYSFPEAEKGLMFHGDEIIPLLRSGVQNTFTTHSSYNTFIPIRDPQSKKVVGGLNIGILKRSVYNKAARTLSYLIFTFAAFILVTLSVLYWSIKRKTKPLEVLAGKALSLGKGDLAVRMDVCENNEIGSLAQSFNFMAEQLEEANTKTQEELAERIRAEADLKQKSEELVKVSEDLRHALESQKRFLASMSHEIRTPLNSIIGFGDILSTTSLDAHQRQLLQYTQKSADHLLSLICDVLDVSKIDAGQLDLKTESFDLRELLMECMTAISSRLNKAVEFLSDIPEMDFHVMGDPMRIKQVFLNLLGNAAKFTERGFIKLSMVVQDGIYSGTSVFKFCVEDTGRGIPADKMHHLFVPFKQMHSSKYGGTGLGLYLSRSFVRLMGGDIEVISKEGVGTKFYVSFVLGTIQKPSKKDTASRRWEAAADRFSALKVLVVEDVEINILLAQAMLQTFFSIRPDVAQNGREALEMVKKTTYDIILMDVQMPEMDGIEATQEMRKSGIKAPIIAVSANALSVDVNNSLAAGINDYITKPVKKEAIESIFEKFFPSCGAGKVE